jgi:hypothetical protein
MIIVAIAIWGGVSSAFDIKNSDGSITVDIDKEKVFDSIQNGAQKAKNVIDNIDKISTEPNN